MDATRMEGRDGAPRGFTLREIVAAGPFALPPRPAFGLWYQTRGEGTLVCPVAGPLDVHSGRTVLHDTNANVHGRHGPNARALLMEIEQPFLSDVARAEFGLAPPDALASGARILADPALMEMQLALWRMTEADCDMATVTAVARAVAVRLLGHHLIEAPRSAPAQRLARVLDFIEHHLDETLRLDAMAGEAGLSIFHFSRVFQREMGLSPQAHVRARRVERARRLLKSTELPLAEIAFACGFAHQSHFTAVFRELTGTTPGSFRDRGDPPDETEGAEDETR